MILLLPELVSLSFLFFLFFLKVEFSKLLSPCPIEPVHLLAKGGFCPVTSDKRKKGWPAGLPCLGK